MPFPVCPYCTHKLAVYCMRMCNWPVSHARLLHISLKANLNMVVHVNGGGKLEEQGAHFLAKEVPGDKAEDQPAEMPLPGYSNPRSNRDQGEDNKSAYYSSP